MHILFKSVVYFWVITSHTFLMASQLDQTNIDTGLPILIMGYKEGSKPPYIGAKNDNSGAYQELFSKAANKIGYQLKIIRLPKKRIYHQLKEGEIDFYPSSGFSEKRASYLYWFPNGFVSKQALLSNITDTEITDFTQAEGILLSPLGSSVNKYAHYNYQISVQKMGVLPIDKAVLALKLDRGNFYIYDIDILDYYLKRQGLQHFEEISLRVHPNAVQKEFSSLHAAFSIYSKHFKSIPNPEYKASKNSGFHNQKLIPSDESIAHAFAEALKELRLSGETGLIYKKYFK